MPDLEENYGVVLKQSDRTANTASRFVWPLSSPPRPAEWPLCANRGPSGAGYFLALLGRDRVCALKRGQVEIPRDIAGFFGMT